MLKEFALIIYLLLQILAIHSEIINLTSENYEQAITNEPLLMVNFHAPWCGHCKTLSPILEKVALDLESQIVQAKIAEFDASSISSDDIIESEGILGFPTLLVFKDGKRISEYKGHRTSTDIVEFLKLKSGPAAKVIQSLSEIEPLINQLDQKDLYQDNILALVLGLFPHDDTHDNQNVIKFLELATNYDLALFYVTNNPQLLEKYNIQEDSIVVITGKDENLHRMMSITSKDLSVDMIAQRILEESIPLVISYNSDIQPIIQSIPIKAHVLLFYSSEVDNTEFLNHFVKVANTFKGRLLFIEVNSDEYHVHSYFNLKITDLPQVIIADMSNEADMKKFIFSDYLHTMNENTENIEKGDHLDTYSIKLLHDEQEQVVLYNELDIYEFFYKFFNNTLQRSLISETTVQLQQLNNNAGNAAVENVISTNFKERVIDPGWDALVYFHAPWCAHCKSIEPIISEVGKSLKSDPTIKIFRIDGSKNEIDYPGLGILGYPTIYYIPANRNRQPIEYGGDRTIEAIVSFLHTFRESSSNNNDSNNENNENKKPGDDIKLDDSDKVDADGTKREVEIEVDFKN